MREGTKIKNCEAVLWYSPWLVEKIYGLEENYWVSLKVSYSIYGCVAQVSAIVGLRNQTIGSLKSPMAWYLG
jgi:hypothetical protein